VVLKGEGSRAIRKCFWRSESLEFWSRKGKFLNLLKEKLGRPIGARIAGKGSYFVFYYVYD